MKKLRPTRVKGSVCKIGAAIRVSNGASTKVKRIRAK